MFKKLHYQLTAMCAMITIIILAVSTALYLFVSEQTLLENNALSFQHDFDALCISLEQQTSITYSFLLNMEQTNDCLIFIWDNGNPLSFNSLYSHAPYSELAEDIYLKYLAGIDDSAPDSLKAEISANGRQLNTGISYIYTGQMNALQKSLALRQRKGLVLLVISPNTGFKSRILHQRVLFLLLSLTGCVFLTLFAYIFTGRMLRPIRQNQERQLEFISGASHELRTPLAVIISAIEAKPPHFEDTIKSETLRMGRLVNDLLTLTRNLSPDRRPSLKDLDKIAPDTFILNFYENMEAYVNSHGQKFSLELSDETFPFIYADNDKLSQLLEILVQNAINYNRKDGIITILLTRDTRSGNINICVRDNGIGIPDSEKDKIFERFYRVDSAHNSKEHFGLGLSIAKEIMVLHHGKIYVTDTPGGGCTFTCSFPPAE